MTRPDAFKRLYPKLLEGYLLDAIELLDAKPAPVDRQEKFVVAVTAARQSRRPSAGLGDDIRLRGTHVVGSGPEYEGELIQLCAFSSENRDGGASSRIMRPSRRR
jgi:hypothetical protein